MHGIFFTQCKFEVLYMSLIYIQDVAIDTLHVLIKYRLICVKKVRI